MKRSDYLTVREAAEVLRVTRQRVHFMLASGQLPYIWVGSQRVIRRDEFDSRFGARLQARADREAAERSQLALEVDGGGCDEKAA